MKITGLTKIGRNHYKVYTDGSAVPSFELHGSDLRRYDLHDGSEISEDVYRKITEELSKAGIQQSLSSDREA